MKAVKTSRTSENVSSKFKELCSLPDFRFPLLCTDLSLSRDQRKLLAIGKYKPSVKLFDLKTLTLKFERNLVCDPLRVISLDNEADKFAVLRNDKTLEFHLNSGVYERIKTPQQPRSIVLNNRTAELYMGGCYYEIYRFNFEQGRFLKSIQSIGGENLSISNINGILGASMDNNIAFFDSRTKEEIFTRKIDDNISGFAFDETGIKYALCTDTGVCLEHDFRSEKPIRNTKVGSTSNKIMYSKTNLLCSTGSNICLWQADNNIEYLDVGFTINTFDGAGGILFVGGEEERIKGYCSDVLGDYNSWFIDAIPK